MSGDLGVDVRATLNPLVAKTRGVAPGAAPEGVNIATILTPGDDGFPETEAYDLLVAEGFAPARVSKDEVRLALAENIEGGSVGGVPVAQLDKDETRARAYNALAEAGKVPLSSPLRMLTRRLRACLF